MQMFSDFGVFHAIEIKKVCLDNSCPLYKRINTEEIEFTDID